MVSSSVEDTDGEARRRTGQRKSSEQVRKKKARKSRSRGRERVAKRKRTRERSDERHEKKKSKFHKLADELAQATQGRDEFSRFEDIDFETAAGYFAKFGFFSLDEIKKAKQKARDFFIEDLRAERLTINDIRLVLEIFELCPPAVKNRNTKNPEFEEICLPVRRKSLAVNLEQLSGWLRPDQLMVNAISAELAKALATSPAYTPFVVLDVSKKPWVPGAADHVKAVESCSSRMKNFKSAQQLSFQSWMLYMLRFFVAAEACKAWDSFGGLIAQLNNLGVVLNIAITENVATALLYDTQLRAHLADLARQRAVNVDYFMLLSEENVAIKRQTVKDMAENYARPKQRPRAPSTTRARNNWTRRPQFQNNSWDRNNNFRGRRENLQGHNPTVAHQQNTQNQQSTATPAGNAQR